jgi:hypothetical protein
MRSVVVVAQPATAMSRRGSERRIRCDQPFETGVAIATTARGQGWRPAAGQMPTVRSRFAFFIGADAVNYRGALRDPPQQRTSQRRRREIGRARSAHAAQPRAGRTARHTPPPSACVMHFLLSQSTSTRQLPPPRRRGRQRPSRHASSSAQPALCSSTEHTSPKRGLRVQVPAMHCESCAHLPSSTHGPDDGSDPHNFSAVQKPSEH